MMQLTAEQLSSFVQAGTKGAWLTGQNRHVVFYEKRINRDVFSYIEGNRLYDASNQTHSPRASASISQTARQHSLNTAKMDR